MNCLIDELLDATLENARKSELFGSLLEGKDKFHWDLIPFTSRHDILKAGYASIVDDGSASTVCFSGGTTGNALAFEISDQESDFLNHFFTKLSSGTPHRCGIRLCDGVQACERRIPTPIRFHDISIYTPGVFDHIVRLCRKSQNCTVFAGGQRMVRTFALWLRDQCTNRDPISFEYVFTYGFCLSPFARNLISDTLSTVIVDRYGLSEVCGGATECRECGWYHFDPHLLAEAICPSTKARISDGLGVVVLTPLYPFQQRQPLIRYWTGDLATFTTKRSCRIGELSMKPRGRLSHSCLAPDGNVLLTESDFVDSLDSLTGIGREKALRDSCDVKPHWPVGRPIWVAEATTIGSTTRIAVQLPNSQLGIQQQESLSDKLLSIAMSNSPHIKATVSVS